MEKPTTEYKYLNDLTLVAVLHYFGIREDSLNRDVSGKTYFNFCATRELSDLIKDFYAGQLKVDPATFALHLKSAKNQIYRQGI